MPSHACPFRLTTIGVSPPAARACDPEEFTRYVTSTLEDSEKSRTVYFAGGLGRAALGEEPDAVGARREVCWSLKT